MPAKASSRSPSPASRAPTDLGTHQSCVTGAEPCRSRLAGDGVFKIAIASKLAPTGFWGGLNIVWFARNLVGAGLPAMASSRSLSPASWLLQVFWGGQHRVVCTEPCRSWLAGDGVFEIAFAGKPCSYRACVAGNPGCFSLSIPSGVCTPSPVPCSARWPHSSRRFCL